MYSDIASNKRRTFFIMLIFFIFVGAIAWLLTKILGGNIQAFIFVIIMSIVYMTISYYAGSKMALGLNKAQKIEKSDNPRLFRIVENLTITDGLPMPDVYIIDDPAGNAFATGRDPKHSSVCVTSGLLNMMNDDELTGVIAHELSHIKNYDIRVNMIAFALTAIISILADVIIRIVWFSDDRDNQNDQYLLILGVIAAILAPIIAVFIQLAISRQREYLADASGALTTRYPEGLASALEKLKQNGTGLKNSNTSTAHLFFASPLKKHSLTHLFDTHPPLDDRIARLRKMDSHA